MDLAFSLVWWSVIYSLHIIMSGFTETLVEENSESLLLLVWFSSLVLSLVSICEAYVVQSLVLYLYWICHMFFGRLLCFCLFVCCCSFLFNIFVINVFGGIQSTFWFENIIPELLRNQILNLRLKSLSSLVYN